MPWLSHGNATAHTPISYKHYCHCWHWSSRSLVLACTDKSQQRSLTGAVSAFSIPTTCWQPSLHDQRTCLLFFHLVTKKHEMNYMQIPNVIQTLLSTSVGSSSYKAFLKKSQSSRQIQCKNFTSTAVMSKAGGRKLSVQSYNPPFPLPSSFESKLLPMEVSL